MKKSKPSTARKPASDKQPAEREMKDAPEKYPFHVEFSGSANYSPPLWADVLKVNIDADIAHDLGQAWAEGDTGFPASSALPAIRAEAMQAASIDAGAPPLADATSMEYTTLSSRDNITEIAGFVTTAGLALMTQGEQEQPPVTAERVFAEKLGEAAAATAKVRREVAESLRPALNAYLQTKPQATLDDKKAVCDLVNGTLEPLGLAVQEPKTGLPAKLKATSGNWPGVGSFHFEVYIDGQLKKPSFSDTLPELQLTDAHALEAGTNWQGVVGPKTSRRGRHRS